MRTRSLIPSLLALLGAASVALTPSVADAGRCPNVQIILDRSGSTSTPGPGGSRASVADEAVKRLANKLGGQLPLGMSVFPGSGCDVHTTIPPSSSSAADILRTLSSTTPGGSSPVGTAVRASAMLAALRDPTRMQYQILITDGNPSCAMTIDTQAGTEAELAAALRQTPSIATYVIGLDGGASAMDIGSLTDLATAGGKPAPTAAKYYAANSPATAQTAVDAIIADLLPAGGCDDSCYATGCARLSDLCILGMCRPNPCSGVTCPTNQYCYTDGVSPGACVKACTARCPAGTRCRAGACIADPCGGFCPPSTVCDAGLRRCVADPLCMGVSCKGTSRCSAGVCVEEPCSYITCPARTRCVPWEGSCEFDDGMTPPDMTSPGPADMAGGGMSDLGGGGTSDLGGGTSDLGGGGTSDLGGGVRSDLGGDSPPDFSLTPIVTPDDTTPQPASGAGCSTAPGSSHAASLFVLAALACAFALLRRIRQPLG